MLNKNNIIYILNELKLSANEYWITSGAALVLHGVKESTRDIDLGCTTDLVEYFIKKGCKYRVSGDNKRIVEVNDEIELLENWVVDEVEFIDGLPLASLLSVRKQKEALGREKDIADIKMIDEYIKYAK
jgi:hypothetical protein